MRVLVVTTWLPTESSMASGIFIERDIDLLAEDHEVRVVHLSAARSAAKPLLRSWELETIPMTPSNPVSVIAASKRLRVLLDRYDLVHTMAASTLLPFRRINPRQPWVHTEHLSGILAPATMPIASRLALPSLMRQMSRPDVVVAVGELLADRIRLRRHGPVIVVPNHVEQPEVPAPRRLNADGRLSLVSVGGLVPRKGADIAVSAVAELVDRGTNVTLRWIGEGSQRPEVVALAERLGVSDRVTFVGSQPPAVVLRELADADVFLLPTAGETFGVSIAEALASGRPVVVGASGGHTEFVSEPDGVLVAGRDSVAYADAILRVRELNLERSAEDIAARARGRFTDEIRRGLYRRVYDEAKGLADDRRR